jgi:hypothetical protein
MKTLTILFGAAAGVAAWDKPSVTQPRTAPKNEVWVALNGGG